MIYFVLLLIIVFCSAVMDGEAGIANYFLKKGWMRLYEWSDSDSWENKYRLQDWFIEHGFQPWFARFMAQDVLVVLVDMWHFAKAVMFLCIEIMVATNTIQYLPEWVPMWAYVLALFIVAGSLFNIIYYKIRKA